MCVTHRTRLEEVEVAGGFDFRPAVWYIRGRAAPRQPARIACLQATTSVRHGAHSCGSPVEEVAAPSWA